jgi:hypothetical protein
VQSEGFTPFGKRRLFSIKKCYDQYAEHCSEKWRMKEPTVAEKRMVRDVKPVIADNVYIREN